MRARRHLGRALAARYGAAFCDSDDFFWLPTDPPYKVQCPPADRLTRLLSRLAEQPRVVVAGSVQEWGLQIEDAFDLIVFLRVPTEVRLARLRQRDLDRFGRVNTGFLAWAAQYELGVLKGRSLPKQLSWLGERNCEVLRLTGSQAVEQYVDQVHARLIEAGLQHSG